MKISKVSSRVRYAAFLSPVSHLWHVRRQVLSESGAWVTRPCVVWSCISEHSAGQTADKQAALERHLIRERANAE